MLLGLVELGVGGMKVFMIEKNLNLEGAYGKVDKY